MIEGIKPSKRIYMTSVRTNKTESASPAKVLRRFRVVFNAVRTHFRQMEKQVGLGGAQVWALGLIRDNPGIGMGGVATHMDIHQSTASNLVKALVQKKLIKMEKAEIDKRNVELHILPAGMKILSQASGPFEGVLPVALGNLNEKTLGRLDKDLGELIRLLQADEAAEEIPLADI
jgi:DNA-binding MarR family transcriptional regulator